MARLRLLLEGHAYHVASVTRDRVPIFRDAPKAQVLIDALQWLRRERSYLLAYVVMPDHFHAVLVPRDSQTISSVMQSVKGYSARCLNGEGRGSLWQQSFYDRVMRNKRHLVQTVRYIHDNPVVAGLATHPEDYQMSSAFPGAITDLETFL